MTTHTFTSTYINSEIGALAASVKSAMLAVGLVQTADTGQANPASLTTPGTANTSAGFLMFRFNDEAQATRPLFVRVDFMTTARTTGAESGNPWLRFTIGRGSDGAGALTSTIFTAEPGRIGSTATTNAGQSSALPCIASGGEGYFALVMLMGRMGGNGGVCPSLVIERTSAGAGLMVMVGQSTQGTAGSIGLPLSAAFSLQASMPSVYAIDYDTAAVNVGVPPVIVPALINGVALGPSSALAAGTLGPTFPWVVFPPGRAPHQSKAAMSYPGGDAPTGVFAAVLEGEERTFYAVPLSDGMNSFGQGFSQPESGVPISSRYVGLAIRWE